MIQYTLLIHLLLLHFASHQPLNHNPLPYYYLSSTRFSLYLCPPVPLTFSCHFIISHPQHHKQDLASSRRPCCEAAAATVATLELLSTGHWPFANHHWPRNYYYCCCCCSSFQLLQGRCFRQTPLPPPCGDDSGADDDDGDDWPGCRTATSTLGTSDAPGTVGSSAQQILPNVPSPPMHPHLRRRRLAIKAPTVVDD